MTTNAPRLPHFAEYAPQGNTPGATRVRLASDASAAFQWRADASVELRAARPTPVVERLVIQFQSARFLQALGEQWSMLPHSQGAIVCCVSPSALRTLHMDALNVASLNFQLRTVPLLKITTGAHDDPCDYQSLERALPSALPLERYARDAGWRLDRASVYAACIDAGWNLPIPRAPGTFTLVEQHDELRLVWDALASERRPSIPDPATDDELEALYLQYDRHQAPATAALLSAATLHSAIGAHLAMRVAATAARRGDTNTLRVLRVSHQRALDNGRQSIDSLAALISCNAALGDSDRAWQIVPQIEARIAADLRRHESAGWITAHIRALLSQPIAQSVNESERRVTPTPRGGLEALPAFETPEILTAVSNREFAETPIHLTRVELARISSNLPAVPAVPAARPAPHASFSFAQVAFIDDNDEAAWILVHQAIDSGARVEDEDDGAMILRLAAIFQEDRALLIQALRAILDGSPSLNDHARAAHQLAQLFKDDEPHASLGVIEQALKRNPDALVLLVARAQLLSVTFPANAIGAWRHVLAHPELERWEAQRYRAELALVLKDSDQSTALLDELRALHLRDAGNSELTSELATLLEERAAIDEAILVRARHAAVVGSLKGYPSIALVVQAVTTHKVYSLTAAIASAQAIHLAASIAHPSTWLNRALVLLAERFDDPLILEYALQAAIAIGDDGATQALRSKLDAHVADFHDKLRALAPRSLRRDDEDDDEEDDDVDAREGNRSAQPFLLTADQLPPYLDALAELFPASYTSSDDELDAIQRKLSASRPADQRASLLARRALLLLMHSDFGASSMAWTGAMILAPHDLRLLAGLTVARAAAGEGRAAASSRDHLLEELSLERRHALAHPALIAIAARFHDDASVSSVQ